MSESTLRILWIAVGGALGSVLRFLISGWVQQSILLFPLGTMVVNILGCLLIGLLSIVLLESQVDPVIRTGILIGLLGGFTTFSSFTHDTLRLAEARQFGLASLNVLASVLCCLLATFLGMQLGRMWMMR
jgi:CrcB protein